MGDVFYSKERLEEFFKENYPVNWYTWLRDVFCSLKEEDLQKMDNSNANYNE